MPTATGHTTAIRATDVIGPNLYDKSGKPIGKIEDLILDKTSNRIMFAVVSIGGVTTTSASYHPMPWEMLNYDENLRGYIAPCTQEQLAQAPAVSVLSELTSNDGAGPRDAAYGHFKT